MSYQIITFRVAYSVAEDGPSLSTSAGVHVILKPIFADLDVDQEHFVLLSLNNNNRVIGYKVISSGCMNSSQVDMKLLFRAALALGGAALVIAHNHPSGDIVPSQADILLTGTIKKACKLMEYSLLDHLIVGAGKDYYSFADHGTL